jgi:hypothetical protein
MALGATLSTNNRRTIYEAQLHLQTELLSLGYKPQERNTLVKVNKVITFSCSSEYNPYYIAVFWREHWESNFAHIYDYWTAGGPTCIVPTKVLFDSAFIKMKKELPSHDRNPYFYKGKKYYWWRQKVKPDHELAQLVIKYKNRWDLL